MSLRTGWCSQTAMTERDCGEARLVQHGSSWPIAPLKVQYSWRSKANQHFVFELDPQGAFIGEDVEQVTEHHCWRCRACE